MLSSIKNSIEDMYLKHHVKSLVERYYLMQGLSIKDVERMTNRELLEVLKELLEVQHRKNNELELRNSSMMKVIEKQDDVIKTLEKINDDLYDRNEGLVKQIYDRNDYMKSNELAAENDKGLEVI